MNVLLILKKFKILYLFLSFLTIPGLAFSANWTKTPTNNQVGIYEKNDNQTAFPLGFCVPGCIAGKALTCDDENDIAVSLSCNTSGTNFPKITITRYEVLNEPNVKSKAVCAWQNNSNETYDLEMRLFCLRIPGNK